MIFLPLFTSLLILSTKKESTIKYLSFISSITMLIISIFMLPKAMTVNMSFEEKYEWIKSLNINYHLGVDNLSMLMILLVNFLMPIAILSSFSYIKHTIKKYYFWMMILHSAMIGVFSSLDAVLFYIFWEAILIPMYFLIGIWGGENRTYASVKFFIYTMSASVLFIVGIIILSLNLKGQGNPSFYIMDLYKNTLSGNLRLFVFISFFLAFSVKIPLLPFHTWLPDAHVEAPTAASVILAGVLLKMGAYGYIRFLIPCFPDLSLKYSTIVAFLGAIATIYAGFMAWMQTDIKKLIAYSSISHMGLVVLGIFSFNQVALSGSILQMINHGISSAALFLAVGIMYERMHTRFILDYGGIFKIIPFFSTFFMIIILSSIGLPTTNGFVGEFLTIIGAFKSHRFLALLSLTGMIIGAVYMLSAYEKIFFGSIQRQNLLKMNDLNIREWIYTIPLVLAVFFIGIYPDIILSKINEFATNMLNGVLK
ncbi:MAG: complex I subunit 4 family protein [Elusimicrobiales bacterium]